MDLEPVLDLGYARTRLCVSEIYTAKLRLVLILNSAWGLAYIRRGNGNSALYFLSILSSSYITRTIYVTYVAVTIAASTSATIEAFLCLTGVKKNGLGGVSQSPFYH